MEQKTLKIVVTRVPDGVGEMTQRRVSVSLDGNLVDEQNYSTEAADRVTRTLTTVGKSLGHVVDVTYP